MGRMQEYIRETQNLSQPPQNIYEHSTQLLADTEKKDYSDLENLTSRRVRLANVGNDILLQLEQDEVRLLIALGYEGQKNAVCKHLFKILYLSWVNSIDLTRAKDGKERDAQGRIGSNIPPNYQTGYGAELPQFQPTPTEQGNDPFSRFIGNIGKKR